MTQTPTRRGLFALFLICMGTLMYELALTRIFSVMMWYHFASMAISLALFGGGVAALAIHLFPERFPVDQLQRDSIRYSRLFALGVTLFFGVFVLFNLFPHLGFKVLSFFHQPFFQPFQQGVYNRELPAGLIILIALLYLATAIPFFCSGIVITLQLTRNIGSISRLYFWDLCGAGFGCLLIIPVLKLAGGISALLVIALIGLAAATLYAPASDRRPLRLHAIAGAVILLLIVANTLFGIADIRFARGRFEPNILWHEWNSFSRVAVYPTQSQTMERAWGLSATYTGPIPEQLGMVVDDTGYTTLYKQGGPEEDDFFRFNVIALPYALKTAPTAAVIGPGGGKDVRTALAMGSKEVVAVEVNGLIAKAVNEVFADFTGTLYRDPQVTLAVDEGRSFIRRSDRSFDIIQASAVFGRMPPAAGAFTLSENNLYTVESFRDYWDHLSDDGILTISRFIFERESLRLVSLGLATLKEMGIEHPEQHIAVIRERGLANFMLKKSPFTDAELAELRRLTDEREYAVVYLPGSVQGTKIYQELIASKGSEAFYESFPYDITPTTDDRPFFYYMLKPADFLRSLTSPEEGKFEDRAIIILRNLLGAVTLLVTGFMLIPLFLWQRHQRGKIALLPIPYFASLGLGFMFVEIGLLRSFILFLGHPIYALAVILFSLLIFSGIGSRLSGGITEGRERRALTAILLALVLLVILWVILVPQLFGLLIGEPLVLRCLIAVLLIAPPALLMGMPMPLGFRIFHPAGEQAPWSWGINGATSVLGTLLAVVVAMNFGFRMTILGGILIYLLALIPVGLKRRP